MIEANDVDNAIAQIASKQIPDSGEPDAALIQACAAVETANAAFHSVCAETNWNTEAGDAAQQAAADRRNALLDRVEGMPAVTWPGLRTKATILSLMLRTDGPSDGVLRSLLADLGAELPAG